MDINLQSLKSIVNNVYEEISHLPIVENLPIPRKDPNYEIARASEEFCSKLVETERGEDLLFRYKLALWQIQEVNQESTRLANLASTRMSNVHQNLNEKYEVLTQIQTQLHQIPGIVKQLEGLNRQISELNRFFLQTEIAFMSLEAIDQQISSTDRDTESIS